MTDGPGLSPAQTALLVMDFQDTVLGRLPDCGELVARMASAIALARGRGVTIGYVWVAFTDADYAAVPAANQTFATLADSRAMHVDAPETAIDSRLAPQPGDIVVRKTRVGAFSTTDLDAQLRERGITTLVLAGIATSGVVLSTLRDAADRDYRLFVLSDGTADRDPEVHEVLTGKVFPRQAQVITTAGLASLLSAG
jgi:nicotinamidase-related amidase